MSVSSRLPHTGTKFGFEHGTGICHERIARILTTVAPARHGRRHFVKSTGRKTAYSRPSRGILLMSCTSTEVVPRQVSKLPLLSKSAQKVTYSRLPALHRLPE